MADKKRSKADERYYARYKAGLGAANKQRKVKRERRRIALDAAKRLRVPRGTRRAMRRRDIVKFNAERRARLQRSTGTIKVNAPSLEMLGKYIGRVGA